MKRLLCVNDSPPLLDLNSSVRSSLLAAEESARHRAPCHFSASLGSRENRPYSKDWGHGSKRLYLPEEHRLPSLESAKPINGAVSAVQHAMYMATS